MDAKVLRTVYLDADKVKKIKKLSEKTRVPQAEYIREGLELLLRKYQRKVKQL